MEQDINSNTDHFNKMVKDVNSRKFDIAVADFRCVIE
jgi:hypothetical protein